MARSDSRRMKRLKQQFFDEGKRLDARLNPDADCWMCRQRIDYDVEAGTTPASHELDHYYPVSTYPELTEDPSNFRHAHKLCNAKRGNTAPVQGLGEQIANWW